MMGVGRLLLRDATLWIALFADWNLEEARSRLLRGSVPHFGLSDGVFGPPLLGVLPPGERARDAGEYALRTIDVGGTVSARYDALCSGLRVRQSRQQRKPMVR